MTSEASAAVDRRPTAPFFTPDKIPALFNDKPNNPVLHYERFLLPRVRQDIDEQGFSIVKGLVPGPRIEAVRAFWLEAFGGAKPKRRVTWSPFLGQENHIGFTSDDFQHLYRSCDFLWN